MVNIFFIHRFPFTKDAFIRDEFEYFTSKGYNVRYLDVSHLLKKKKLEANTPDYIQEYVIHFDTKKAFANFLIANAANSLIVSDVGLLLNSAWMYLAVFKAGVPHVAFENSVMPKVRTKTTVKEGKLKVIKHLKRFNYTKIYNKPIELVDYLRAKKHLQPAIMAITSRKKLNAEKKVLCSKETNIRYSMSLDYKIARQVNESRIIEEDYAVFVDQYFNHHPDFKTNHIVHYFTAEQYYPELNKFLHAFSRATGLKVVIASHPRRNSEQEKDFDSDFELFYNQTAPLIKDAKVSLIHFSTAINFAVLFNKPFILLTSDLFKRSSIESNIEMFASYFEKKPLNLSNYNQELIVTDIDASINKVKYEEFIRDYIKHPKAKDETFRQQIECALQLAGFT
ncbi:hypothetical protein KEM09_01605 [Carboxylicivirga mesophila]|uniref:Uncharacterized protein n=1 Tax=Carboxylicivirga mesophila TaxID=1166478 RepID=A0ABS5K558_9BACT|nr:hypothetical protein [Carboxylicivirga mesophila]MBS2210077.1 hypothetical protein [Carboxylicivirga mesophila]